MDLASGIAGLAHPNQILLSAAVSDSSRERLPSSVAGQCDCRASWWMSERTSVLALHGADAP